MTKFCFLFILVFIKIEVSAQWDKIPGEGNTRYVKKGLHFIVFKKGGIKDTLEGAFVKTNGHSKNYLRLKDGDVYPEKLDSIYLWSKSKDRTSDTMKAVCIDDLFLFNTVAGQIKAYTIVPFNDKKYSIYYQNGNSELNYNTNNFRKKVLPEWVKDDKEAYDHWKEYRSRKMLRIFGPLSTVALGLTLTGVLSKKNPDAAGLAFVATNTWAFWFFIKPIHPSKIIEKYNANKRKDEKFFTE